ncbi:hypothetical protein Kfla_1460 [Kribbella flavida DSM 17836]|uniref:Uncharacterized protein n=1 Tax=Kribbella flavida (strain DSM 17836 / JCM 10339 / NBRC 14399) TaxID=479435 RepID=D2PLD2_KRIFD|nr:hypothetical protein [Kribbella flavida]ADB30561.1 hypothetical protein Kfla_1460 [Kribbella flavida DSM 17836]
MIPSLVAVLSLLAAPTSVGWVEQPKPAAGSTFDSISSGGGALWGVGSSREDGKDWDRPVAARWENGRWQATAQPRTFGRLLDVAVRSANDVWAVGSWAEADGSGGPLVQHWDGTDWREIALPSHPDGVLQSVAVVEDEIWVVGTEGEQSTVFVERYNGKSWLPLTDDVLGVPGYASDIAVVSPDDIWVAAFADGIKHYDGHRWTKAALPGTAGAFLNDFAVVGPNDIWAVGHREDPVYYRTPVAYHFDGKRWSEVRTPQQTGQPLAVEVLNGKPFVVGDGWPDSTALRWTPAGFVDVPTPAKASVLLGAAVHDGRFWALGRQESKLEGLDDTYLAEHSGE